jgi:hypothetical protein
MLVEYAIPRNSSSTLTIEEIGKFIYRLGNEEDFYTHFSNEKYDSLYFYGPDYHHFNFKLIKRPDTFKVILDYFGYHGFRSKPPRKEFINIISDSLQIKFGAEEDIRYQVSNEKIKNGT